MIFSNNVFLRFSKYANRYTIIKGLYGQKCLWNTKDNIFLLKFLAHVNIIKALISHIVYKSLIYLTEHFSSIFNLDNLWGNLY